MLKPIGVLSTCEPVKGIIVNPHGVEVPENVPVLDCHSIRNGCLGHLERAWVEDDLLMGELIFTGARGARAYQQIERGEVGGCSCSLKIDSVAIFDADGTPLDVEEAIERQDDPALVVIAQRTVLREVSITATPADKNAFVRAVGLNAEAWRMIRQGEAELQRILHSDEPGIFGNDGDDEDGDDGMVTLSEFMKARLRDNRRNVFYGDER
jgi:hypothetical protein